MIDYRSQFYVDSNMLMLEAWIPENGSKSIYESPALEKTLFRAEEFQIYPGEGDLKQQVDRVLDEINREIKILLGEAK